tara:strand:- start:1261 stop:1443 length:183 start_codon:yes stop_codon:yes gene_type:complete
MITHTAIPWIILAILFILLVIIFIWFWSSMTSRNSYLFHKSLYEKLEDIEKLLQKISKKE